MSTRHNSTPVFRFSRDQGSRIIMNDYVIQSYVDIVLLDVKDKGGKHKAEHKLSRNESSSMKAFEADMSHLLDLEKSLENFRGVIDDLQNILHEDKDENDSLGKYCLCKRCIRLLDEACTLSLEQTDADIDLFESIITEQELSARYQLDSSDSNLETDTAIREFSRSSYTDAINKLEGAYSLLYEEVEYLDKLEQEQSTDLVNALKREKELITELNYLDHDRSIFKCGLIDYSCKLSDALLLEKALGNSATSLYSSLFKIDIDYIDKYKSYFPVSINRFRLAHRPKGNLKWKELNTAWSEACLLLLVCGGASNFVTAEFKIIPLVDCAKIILKSDLNIIYNLGCTAPEHKWSKKVNTEVLGGIKIFVKLLGQLCSHLEQSSLNASNIPPIPYRHTDDSLGSLAISEIEENDDQGWLTLVSMSASNLHWIVSNIHSYSIS